MRNLSTLALCELLAVVVAELEDRGTHEYGADGVVNWRQPIGTGWGDVHYDLEKGWRFAWHSEASAEAALRDRGHAGFHDLVSAAATTVARELIDEKVAAGEVIRLPGGRLVRASAYDPAVHGPSEAEADAREVIAEAEQDAAEYQVNPR